MTATTSRWPTRYSGRREPLPRIRPLVRVDEDPRFDPRAACGLDACRFFDEKERYESRADFAARRIAAGRVCSVCPLKASCLDWGSRNALTGFIGGRELRTGRPIDTLAAGQS